MFFSPTTGGFYACDIHGDAIPTDAVEITDEHYRALLSAEASGKIITADDSGCPIVIDPPEVPGSIWDGPENCWCRGVVATTSAILAKKNDILSAGFTHGGNTWQIRETDIDNFGRILTAFSLGETSPHGGVYRTQDNVNVTLTDAEMRSLALAACAYHRDVLRAWAAHKDAIATIVSTHPVAHDADEAAEAYDINAGWPENG